MSTSRRYAQVDVFTAQPYLGNPVAVVIDSHDLSTSQMQRFAAWTNLSETVYLLPPSQNRVDVADYRLRIFTPSGELPFAGHPTLGACYVWLAQPGNRPKASGHPDEIVQECGIGLVRIRRSSAYASAGGSTSPTALGVAFQPVSTPSRPSLSLSPPPLPLRLSLAAPPFKKYGPLDPSTLHRICVVLDLDPYRDVLRASWLDNGPGWVALLLRGGAAKVLSVRPRHLETVQDLNFGIVAPYARECTWVYERLAMEIDDEVEAGMGERERTILAKMQAKRGDVGGGFEHMSGIDARDEGGLDEVEPNFEVRAFCPAESVVEDPVTGSLNAGIGVWFRDLGILLPERSPVTSPNMSPTNSDIRRPHDDDGRISPPWAATWSASEIPHAPPLPPKDAESASTSAAATEASSASSKPRLPSHVRNMTAASAASEAAAQIAASRISSAAAAAAAATGSSSLVGLKRKVERTLTTSPPLAPSSPPKPITSSPVRSVARDDVESMNASLLITSSPTEAPPSLPAGFAASNHSPALQPLPSSPPPSTTHPRTRSDSGKAWRDAPLRAALAGKSSTSEPPEKEARRANEPGCSYVASQGTMLGRRGRVYVWLRSRSSSSSLSAVATASEAGFEVGSSSPGGSSSSSSGSGTSPRWDSFGGRALTLASSLPGSSPWRTTKHQQGDSNHVQPARSERAGPGGQAARRTTPAARSNSTSRSPVATTNPEGAVGGQVWVGGDVVACLEGRAWI